MVSAASAAAVETAASAARAAEAGLPARRIAASFSTMVVTIEGAGAHVRLTARFAEAARRMAITVERPGGRASVFSSTAPEVLASGLATAHVVGNAAFAAAPVIVVAVIECIGMRIVPVMVVNHVAVAPVKSPVAPSPPETAPVPNSKAYSEGEVRSTKPYAGIVVPIRPRSYWISVNEPGIVRRHINNVRLSGLNQNIGSFVLYHLLRRRFQIAC